MAPNRGSSGMQAYWYLAVSLLSLGLIPLITFSGNVSQAMSSDHSRLVWSGFTLICIAGTIAGIRPSSCSRSSESAKTRGTAEQPRVNHSEIRVVDRKGHHYSCEHYSGHVISTRSRVFCAGCTGLALGGTIAAAGSLLHMITGFSYGSGMLLFWFGFTGVAIGLLQHPLYRVLGVQNGFVRIGVNVLFVNGAFLLLYGADQLVHSLSLDTYILIVILFWISTRVVMSRREHLRICTECPEQSCTGR